MRSRFTIRNLLDESRDLVVRRGGDGVRSPQAQRATQGLLGWRVH